MRLKNMALGLSLVAAVALVAGCGGGSDKAKVRLLNASIGSTALDLAVGDDEIVVTSGLAYATVGDYESVDPDDSLLEVQNTTSGATLVSTTPTLAGDSRSKMTLPDAYQIAYTSAEVTLNPVTGVGCLCPRPISWTYGHFRLEHRGTEDTDWA